MKGDEKHYKIWWDDKNEIIRTHCWGNHDKIDATSLAGDLTRIIRDQPDADRILHDVKDCGTASVGAMQEYGRMMQTSQITRRAFLVKEGSTKVTIMLLSKMGNITNTRVFEDEQKALDWVLAE